MITVSTDKFMLKQAFTISRGSRMQADVITVRIHDGIHEGWAESVPYARYGETLDTVTAQIETLPSTITRRDLPDALPAGAARNAVDCALWDLEAKQTGIPVWERAGLSRPVPVQTAFTISLGSPEAMRAAAKANAFRPIIKIKLGTPDDIPRLEAVRKGAPNAKLVVDANEGWRLQDLEKLLPRLHGLGVVVIEQPLPAKDDAALEHLSSPIPICADESCHTAADLPKIQRRYQMANIKLDKTGGLTEALLLRHEAMSQNLSIMVGCMVGSSLAMAPAVLLAQSVDLVDLDGPLLLAEDREQALTYEGSTVHPPQHKLWG